MPWNILVSRALGWWNINFSNIISLPHCFPHKEGTLCNAIFFIHSLGVYTFTTHFGCDTNFVRQLFVEKIFSNNVVVMLNVIPDSTPINAFSIILYILLHKKNLAILYYLYFTFFGDFLMTSQGEVMVTWHHCNSLY